jgi:Methylase involved in ubiquinone/menaquinone biosynthesis
MKLHRNLTNKIHFVLDQLLPPLLLDQRWFMKPLVWILYRKNTNLILDFKSKAPFISEEEYLNTYKKIVNCKINRQTDLSTYSLDFIMKELKGKTILDIPCGKGFLTSKIAEDKTKEVTGADFIISPKLIKKYPQIKFISSKLEKTPFPDKSFDTVICAHCLEHVLDIQTCMKELRRITKKRLIIIVPKQRSHKYTFELHINFFPSTESFLLAIKPPHKNIVCQESKDGGDIHYIEDFSSKGVK